MKRIIQVFAVTVCLAPAFSFAKQVCTEVADSPQLRDAGRKVLADGSVQFELPEVLVEGSTYLPLSAIGAEQDAFCKLHGLKFVSSQSEKVNFGDRVLQQKAAMLLKDGTFIIENKAGFFSSLVTCRP